ERHLCQEAAERGRMVSTLDRLESHQAQSLADAYMRQYGLCLTRPLRVFGEDFGLLTLHYKGRPALFDAELEALGTFADWAAIALYNARARQDLRDFADAGRGVDPGARCRGGSGRPPVAVPRSERRCRNRRPGRGFAGSSPPCQQRNAVAQAASEDRPGRPGPGGKPAPPRRRSLEHLK